MALKDIVERFEEETVIKEDNRVSFLEMLTPAFVGGIIMGILAGVPGLSLFVVLYPIGGYYAAKLVKEYYEKRIDAKDAVKTGAFAGLIGGFFGSLILLVISIFFAEVVFMFFMDIMGSHNASFIMTLSGIDPNVSLYSMRLRFLVNMVLCTVAGAVGGLIFSLRNRR